MEGTIAEIRLFAGTFAPRNWEFCNGQLVTVSEYSSLFSVLGSIYGGDGVNTFGLPDLRDAVVIGASSTLRAGDSGPGLGGTSETKSLAMNYIICMVGLYPMRP